jgi:hypothetical protein
MARRDRGARRKLNPRAARTRSSACGGLGAGKTGWSRPRARARASPAASTRPPCPYQHFTRRPFPLFHLDLCLKPAGRAAPKISPASPGAVNSGRTGCSDPLNSQDLRSEVGDRRSEVGVKIQHPVSSIPISSPPHPHRESIPHLTLHPSSLIPHPAGPLRRVRMMPSNSTVVYPPAEDVGA